MACYFDAHTHLQMIENLPSVMDRAKVAGVRGFICNATSEADWNSVLKIAEKYPTVSVSLGVHPWYISGLTKGWDARLLKILQDYPNAMVGEVGLDKLKPDLDEQEQVLRRQLEIAFLLNRPAHIHCVKAWDRLLHVFKTQRDKMPPRLLMHSHHGNADLIPELMEKYNAYFSYSSIFEPENHPKVQACLKATPLDRLLIESDAPDLSAEPAVLPELVKKMAVITGHQEDVLTQSLFDNAREFVYGR